MDGKQVERLWTLTQNWQHEYRRKINFSDTLEQDQQQLRMQYLRTAGCSSQGQKRIASISTPLPTILTSKPENLYPKFKPRKSGLVELEYVVSGAFPHPALSHQAKLWNIPL